MYLNDILIQNSGPIEDLVLTLLKNPDGTPKPLVLLGSNGSGKTTFLSLVSDALFECASLEYEVLEIQGSKRAYFRTIGGRNVRLGSKGTVSVLSFEEDGRVGHFFEKAGEVDKHSLKTKTPTIFHDKFQWNESEDQKAFRAGSLVPKDVFANGVYCFLPSSRNETPYWLNKNINLEIQFDVSQNFRGQLKKPIFVERTLNDFSQWLIGLLADVRSDILVDANSTKIEIRGNPINALLSAPLLKSCNQILRLILDDDQVSFVWLGRNTSQKVGIAKNNQIIISDLASLSTGQSVLLGIFGTLLRYGDISSPGSALSPGQIKGICVIDEIDSHIHIDLQAKAIPKLIKLFSRIQFICTTHSPFFGLGMEEQFGPLGFHLLELPSGTPISTESFGEFSRALELFQATKSFDQRLAAEVGKGRKPIVFTEGQTDPMYLRAAALALGMDWIVDEVEIEWIGDKPNGKQAVNTGHTALKHAARFLSANTQFTDRKVLLLGDADTGTLESSDGKLFARILPFNEKNKTITKGIENLLPESVFEAKFFSQKRKDDGNGKRADIEELKKVELCEYLCTNGNAATFRNFSDALELICHTLSIQKVETEAPSE